LAKTGHPRLPTLADDFRHFILNTGFPCVGTKSALAKGTLDLLIACDMQSNWDNRRIYEGISRVVEAYRVDRAIFRSLAVIFEGPLDLGEAEFETL
jgi:uncharacterized protein